MSLPANMSEKSPSIMVYGRDSVSTVDPLTSPPSPVSPLTPSEQSRRISDSSAPPVDISRLAGFPQSSHFDHERPESPSGRRQPSNSRPISLRLVIPTNPAPRGGHITQVVEAPPPYSQYGHPTDRVWGLPPLAHVHQSRDRPRRQSGQREPHVLTLGNTRQQQQRQPKGTSAVLGNGYWEAIVCENGQGKKRLTRKGRICIFGSIILILVVIATSAAVIVTTSQLRKGSSGSAGASSEGPSAMSAFPDLPLGLAVIKPQGQPVVTNTCVSPSFMWSCHLPPDSLFPTTPSPSDGSNLPEFRFTIAARNSSDSREVWISIPEKAPNATDYSKLAEADKILTDPNSGEATPYYISLSTEGSDDEQSTRTVTRHTRRQDGPPPRTMLPVVARNQPLRFFNRETPTEHFGFYMYFTKNIRVNLGDEGSNPPGGLAAGAAIGTDVRFEKTRFRVAIWTRSREDGSVELIDDQGRRVHSDAGVNGLPYAVSIIEDRLGDKGSVNHGNGLSKVITENPDGECRCEWTNFREKVE